MATILSIDNLIASDNGRQAIATLSGTPTGALKFLVSREPDVSTAVSTSFTVQSVTGYIFVDVPNDFLWYVWAGDDNGYITEPEAVFVGTDSKLFLGNVGRKLQSILNSNKKGLNVILQKSYPSMAVREVVYGTSADISDWPSICIRDGRARSEWLFLPFGLRINVSFTIQCIVVHEEEKTQADLVADFAQTVSNILQSPHYQEFSLDDGVQVQFGMISDIGVDDMQVGGKRAASGTMQWTGEIIFQRGDRGA